MEKPSANSGALTQGGQLPYRETPITRTHNSTRPRKQLEDAQKTMEHLSVSTYEHLAVTPARVGMASWGIPGLYHQQCIYVVERGNTFPRKWSYAVFRACDCIGSVNCKYQWGWEALS